MIKKNVQYNPEMPLQTNNTYPKEEKLKSKTRITQLFVEGKTLTVFPIKLIYISTDNQKSLIQAGVTVPKKNFKSAVKRNHIKRLLRESYRLNKGIIFNNTEGKFAFLFLYLGKETLPFEVVELKMKQLLNKFNSTEGSKS